MICCSSSKRRMMWRLYDASSASMRISPGQTSLIERNHVSSSTRAELARERLLQARIEPAPERPRAADEVLPEPRLRLVQPERRAARERRALERRVDAVLVQAVAALVHRREEAVERVLRLARRDPDVRRRKRLRKRMRRGVEAPRRVVEAEAAHDLERELTLLVRREVSGHRRRRSGARLLDQRDEHLLQRSKIARTSAVFMPRS